MKTRKNILAILLLASFCLLAFGQASLALDCATCPHRDLCVNKCGTPLLYCDPESKPAGLYPSGFKVGTVSVINITGEYYLTDLSYFYMVNASNPGPELKMSCGAPAGTQVIKYVPTCTTWACWDGLRCGYDRILGMNPIWTCPPPGLGVWNVYARLNHCNGIENVYVGTITVTQDQPTPQPAPSPGAIGSEGLNGLTGAVEEPKAGDSWIDVYVFYDSKDTIILQDS
jgi:hypothetical protein